MTTMVVLGKAWVGIWPFLICYGWGKHGLEFGHLEFWTRNALYQKENNKEGFVSNPKHKEQMVVGFFLTMKS